MKLRLASICFLTLLLLNGAVGSSLAAVLCPHSADKMSCCFGGETKQDDSMDGMQMDMPNEAAAAPGGRVAAVGSAELPVNSCQHCIAHSQTVNSTILLREENQNVRRIVPAVSAVARLTPREPFFHTRFQDHSPPPGIRSPSQVMLNIFRI